MKRELYNKLADVIQNKLNEQIRLDEIRWLDQILAEYPEAVDFYVEMVANHIALSECKIDVTESMVRDHEIRSVSPEKIEGPQSPAVLEDRNLSDEERIRQIESRAKHQLDCFLAEQQRLRQLQEREKRAPWAADLNLIRILNTLGRRIDKTMTFLARTTVRVSAVAAMLIVVFGIVHYLRGNRVVASLEQTVHAQWAQAPDANELRPGWLTLQQGYAHITFNSGAKVLIQAPCQFHLDSPKMMTCIEGTVTTEVPQPARGFAIKTPSAKITDYGTAFGIFVDVDRRADVQVFSGEVGIRSTQKKEHNTNTVKLREGQNALADQTTGIQIGKARRSADQFVSDLPDPDQIGIPGKQLNLADLVGGGNGYGTGILDQGIDAATGNSLPQASLITKGGSDQSGRYHAVSHSEYIDGVFVPFGGKTPVTISSTGLGFAQCPITNGTYLNGIINGAKMTHGQKNALNPSREFAAYQGQLDGIVYGVPKHPAITMHANVGITFDLDRIRHNNPGKSLESFQVLCGVSETVIPFVESGEEETHVDFWILVDGVVMDRHACSNASGSTKAMRIVLSDKVRFLTLATTTSGGIKRSFALFADPIVMFK